MRRPKVHTATPVRWDMPHCKPRATGYGSIPKKSFQTDGRRHIHIKFFQRIAQKSAVDWRQCGRHETLPFSLLSEKLGSTIKISKKFSENKSTAAPAILISLGNEKHFP